MMTSCYIIDDEQQSVDYLVSLINKTDGLQLLGSTTDPTLGLSFLQQHREELDICFIDINMPNLSGVDVVNLADPIASVIFIYDFTPLASVIVKEKYVDLLLKPFSYDRFLEAIERCRNKHINTKNTENADHIYVKCDAKGRILRLDFSQIYYIEAALNYVIIHTGDNRYITYLSIHELQDMLPENHFSRIHRSFIINDRKIHIIESQSVTLTTGESLAIGNSYKLKFINKILVKMPASQRVGKQAP